MKRHVCVGLFANRADRLQSGVISTYGPIPIAFWDRMENWDLSSEPGVPRLPGNSYPHERLFERALECLGSTNNPGVHMIVEKGINDAKNHVSLYSLSSFPTRYYSIGASIIPLT